MTAQFFGVLIRVLSLLALGLVFPNANAWSPYGSFGFEFARGGSSMQVIPFEFKGVKYNLVFIRAGQGSVDWGGREVDARIDPFIDIPYEETRDYIPNVLKMVEDWVIDQNLKENRFPEDSPVHNAMMTTGTVLDGRSSVLFISEFNDITKIKSVLRASRLTKDHSLFPTEMFLRSLGIGDTMERPPLQYTKEHVPFEGEVTVADGGMLELKNFVADRANEADFIPLMFTWGEMLGLFHDAGFDWSTGRPLRRKASKLVLECDRRMIPYYKRMGWRETRRYEHLDSINMELSRDEFLVKLAEMMKRRPGARIMEEFKTWRPLWFAPRSLTVPNSCSDIFANGSFFKEVR